MRISEIVFRRLKYIYYINLVAKVLSAAIVLLNKEFKFYKLSLDV